MIELKSIQREVIDNKIRHGFNTTDICKEFCLLYGEVGEAYEAYRKKKDDLGEELADVAIYLLGISEILNIDLETEILKKIDINSKRKYKKVNGVNFKINSWFLLSYKIDKDIEVTYNILKKRWFILW